jgi:hypothetical protein
MTKWLSRVLVPIFSVLLLVEGGTAQQSGRITGTVINEKSEPIAHAKVTADPVDGRPRASAVRYVETDDNGRFLFEPMPWGTYRIFAKKEDEGFPDTAFSFYSNDVFTVAEITPSASVAEVRIRLGPRAGIVEGSVTNAASGVPVSAGLKLIRAASSDKWFSTSVPPSYRVLVPSSTDVLLEVSAPGFNTWTPGHPLHLEPGAEMHLDVSLQPSRDPNLHPSRFLVPERYVGWLLLEYNVKDTQPISVENGTKVFKFPANGALYTSSSGPDKGADNEFLFYSADGSTHEISRDYRNSRGMIWGEHEGTRNGMLSQFGFFVGTEEQYKKHQSQATHPGPVPAP